ncbi:MAG: aspartate carbamoyltransferase catalytic subunit [SAR202 cluster bacterium]|nr:aspartate carbamoyltransferase [Chloroflexota bacterium]MQF84484.1 aspartate carbamoyltransferase catalytic subunit [SAR202 cluster bacterium]|tara:strand:+ start:792 stop:1736 length:945 start_codon:yes stop_codon:yes gene_type:complete
MNHLGNHLLDIDHLSKDYIYDFFKETEKIKNTPESSKNFNHNKNICTLFYENSTRTKLSFQKACSNINAVFHNLDIQTSSVNKGETFYNTIKTINSIGMDLIIIRHYSSGAPYFLAKNTKSSVINAGDGAHAHPTQTLSDLFTIFENSKKFEDLEISIIGDVLYSRVARSNILGLLKMGSKINIIGPRELVPVDVINLYSSIEKSYKNKINYYEDYEKPILSSDFLMALRIQKERFDKNTDLNFDTYITNWKIDTKVLSNLDREDIFIMHPGPVNEEIELSHELVHSEKSLISKQVENGVYVRQKIMEKLLDEK